MYKLLYNTYWFAYVYIFRLLEYCQQAVFFYNKTEIMNSIVQYVKNKMQEHSFSTNSILSYSVIIWALLLQSCKDGAIENTRTALESCLEWKIRAENNVYIDKSTNTLYLLVPWKEKNECVDCNSKILNFRKWTIETRKSPVFFTTATDWEKITIEWNRVDDFYVSPSTLQIRWSHVIQQCASAYAFKLPEWNSWSWNFSYSFNARNFDWFEDVDVTTWQVANMSVRY